ncbi:MAG: hypothetical protein LBQ83_05015 [Candidatus Margulisbacteria bacterium]|jgi:hypothetical protein|nr:hypothetical protein [Candidatus Margulisiibacteriota bacterium]
MAVGSIEDSVITKLKLNELESAERISALLSYFNSVITGALKSNPPELKAVLNLLNEYKAQDQAQTILGYINTHQLSIDHFFSNNMQRFDRFEFKPYFLRIKGIEPGQEFAVPVNAKRNFENIRPLDTRMYKNILEQDPQDAQLLKKRLTRLDAYAVEEQRLSGSQKLTALLNDLQQKISQALQAGRATKEQILEKLKFVEELFIPALQIRYNEPALDRLAGLLFDGAEQDAVEEVFSSLHLPQRQRELFCEALARKI